MTSCYVNMITEHLKLLDFLFTSYCVNLVTTALKLLKLHRGPSEPPPRFPAGSKKPGLNRVKVLGFGKVTS